VSKYVPGLVQPSQNTKRCLLVVTKAITSHRGSHCRFFQEVLFSMLFEVPVLVTK